MIYYKKRALRIKLKRFFRNRSHSDDKGGTFLKKALMSVAFFVLFGTVSLYGIYLFLLPDFLNEKNVETFLNNNLKKNSKFILDIENIKVSPDYKFNVLVKADKIKLKYSPQRDFLVLENPVFDVNLLTLLQGYLDLNEIKIKKITLETDFTEKNKYSAFDCFTLKRPEAEFKNIKLKLRNVNLLSDNVIIKIKDENVKKDFYINSKNLKISSGSFMNGLNNAPVQIVSLGEIKTNTSKLSDYNLKLTLKLKDFDIENLNKKFASLNTNPFLYADKYNFYSKNDIDLKIISGAKTTAEGKIALSGMTFTYEGIKLPKNNLVFYFKGDKISTDCNFKLVNNKFIALKALIAPKKFIEVQINSNKIDLAELNSVVMPLAKIFNLKIAKNDFSFQGSMLLNVYLKSDFKKIKSNGKLEINNAKLTSKPLGIVLDNITSNVNFNNNEINIVNSSFNFEKEKFDLSGKISSNSFMNLKVTSGAIKADKLSALLKTLPFASKSIFLGDNTIIKSGTLKINAQITGTIQKPLVSLNSSAQNLIVGLNKQNTVISAKNVSIKSNKNSDILLSLQNLSADINLKGKKSTLKIPILSLKAGNKDIISEKTDVFIDNTPGVLKLKIKNFLTKTPEAEFEFSAQNLNSNNIIRVKNSSPKLFVSGIIKQNRLYLTDCKIFTPNEVLAFIKGTVSNLSSPKPELNLKIVLEKNVSFLIPFVQNLSFDASGSVGISGNVLKPVVFGNLNLKNIICPDYKLKISQLGLNIENSNVNFTAQNIDINSERFDATGRLKYQKNKIIFNSLNVLSGFLDFENLKKYYTKNINPELIEISEFDFASPSVSLGSINLSNLYLNGNLKNGLLNLKEIKTGLFNGTLTGSGVYNLKNEKTKTDLILRDINVRLLQSAIKEFRPVSFAASGKSGGVISVEFTGLNADEIIKTADGYVKFTVKDGELSQFAKLERFLQAGNILSQSILKLSLNSVVSTVTKQNTGDFKLIEGSVMLKNRIADIKYLKTQGTNMSLFAEGKFNLLTDVSNLRVLGRVPTNIVNVTGKLGSFTLQKRIEQMSDDTKEIIGFLGASPIEKMLSTVLTDDELSKIPPLAGDGERENRCFTVIIQGPVQNATSVKNFKWHSAQ